MALELSDGGEWRYFNKGKANILFKYVGKDTHLKGKLLRLRLSDQITTAKQVFEYVENKIRPKLEETIECELATVDFKKVEALNDGFGLLISNLLPDDAEAVKTENYFKTYKTKHTFILELKPKWLTSERDKCRNCAHHFYKFGLYSEFCSLDLLDESTLSSACTIISTDLNVQKAFYEYFTSKDNVLQKLKALQHTDQKISGIKDESEVTDELCTSMTFRDVTVFFIVYDGKIQKTAVTDVDPKSKSKWRHWVSTEKKLVENGYYQSNTKHKN